jgi:hypothetical protein
MKILSIVAISAGLLGFASYASADPPTTDPAAAANPAVKSPTDTSAAPLAKGHNSFTKGQAQDRIQKAGYTNVSGLTLDTDGLWQATAMMQGQSVHVALDYKGDVAAE